MILYFSGCGNSQFVANELAALTRQKLIKINPLDQSPAIELTDNEPLGIVCPVYAWAVPRLVDDYIMRLTIPSKPSYIFLACTCGDNVGRTPEKFAHTLMSKGLSLDAAFSFVMPETYINLPGFKLDSRENARHKIEGVRERLPIVADKIMRRVRVIDVIRGPVPRLTSGLLNPIFYSLIITDRKFHSTNLCISCGLCQKICPLNNITLEDRRPVWHGNCTNCMACYHHCPENAIHFSKATLGKGQYTFAPESSSPQIRET